MFCLYWIELLEYFAAAAAAAEPALEEAAVNVCASAEPAGTPTGAVEEASTAKPSDELAGNTPAATSGASDLDSSTTETSAGHEADSVGALAKAVEDDTNKVLN